MNIHILGVGSIGTLLAFHIQRAIRLSTNTSNPSSSSSLTKLAKLSSSSSPSRFPIPSKTSLTLHLRRTSFPNSSDSIQNRSSNHPLVEVKVESNGITQVESGFKVEYLPFLNRLSERNLRKFNQSNLDKKRNEIESNWKKEKRKAESRHGLVLNSGEQQADEEALELKKQSLKPSSNVPFTGPPNNFTIPSDSESHIDFLIITTKADSTINAIRPLLYRLNQNSTILLLQNGMGVLDELIQTFFQDQTTRPQFLLGITTHGCFRKKGTWIVHAGNGEVDLTVVPGRRSLGFEKGGFDAVQQELLQASDSSSALSVEDTDSGDENKLPQFLNLLKSLPLSVQLDSISDFQLKSLKKLIINSCINPLTSILEVRNGELVGNENIKEMIKGICDEAEEIFLEMSKRRVDSEIYQRENQNRESNSQIGNRRDEEGEEDEAIDVENLTSLDLLTLAITRPSARNSDSNQEPELASSETDSKPSIQGINPSLLSASLISQVEKISILTAKNWSSMAQDLGVNDSSSSSIPMWKPGIKRKGRGSTEISYINGYLIALGNLYGIKTPLNEQLLRLVKAKSQRVMGRWKGGDEG